MRRKSERIPVYTLPPGIIGGIMVMRKSFDSVPYPHEVLKPHRDGGYTFILQEQGTLHIEIDFQTYSLQAPSVIFIHPNQVHRLIAFEQANISTWMITAENLRPEYLHLLNDLTPVNVLTLTPNTAATLSSTAVTLIELSERKTDKLYGSILKDSCNALVALVLSQYLAEAQSTETRSRFEKVYRSFQHALENNYRTVKSPAGYADQLNLSTSYLNECVKATSGKSVSHHIQQRVVLEAKRALYHSNQSVKEIAAELGYDDYSYFTRLFVKLVGMTPVAFRNKNRE